MPAVVGAFLVMPLVVGITALEFTLTSAGAVDALARCALGDQATLSGAAAIGAQLARRLLVSRSL